MRPPPEDGSDATIMPIDFRLRDFWYPRHIVALRRRLDATQWLPRPELEAYRDGLLRATVTHAASTVPYYRELFARKGVLASDIRTLNDLAALPLLTKDQIAERRTELVASTARTFRPRWTTTSGTSGRPTQVLLDRPTQVLLDRPTQVLEFCYCWRHWSWAGYRLGDSFAELGSYFFLQQARHGTELAVWQPLLRRLLINASRISLADASAISDTLRHRRPQFIKGTASGLASLARCLLAAGCELPPFRAIFAGGDTLTPADRALLRRVFRGPVFDSYGHMERTVAISQCERGGYHVNIVMQRDTLDTPTRLMSANTCSSRPEPSWQATTQMLGRSSRRSCCRSPRWTSISVSTSWLTMF